MRGPLLHHLDACPARPARLLGGVVLASLAGIAGLETWLDGRAADGEPVSGVIDAAMASGIRDLRASGEGAGRCRLADPAAVDVEPQALASGMEIVAASAEAGRTAELEAELAALRDENERLAARIAELEEMRDELECRARGEALEFEMRGALRRDFADIVTGSIEAGSRAWSFENELVDILLREARALRPPMIGDPASGLAVPNLETFTWPTFRSAVGDGSIRGVGQALPALLRERGLAPQVTYAGGHCSHSRRGPTLRLNGYSGGQVVTLRSISLAEDDPRIAAARFEAARADEHYREAVEGLVGMRLYDDERAAATCSVEHSPPPPNPH